MICTRLFARSTCMRTPLSSCNLRIVSPPRPIIFPKCSGSTGTKISDPPPPPPRAAARRPRLESTHTPIATRRDAIGRSSDGDSSRLSRTDVALVLNLHRCSALRLYAVDFIAPVSDHLAGFLRRTHDVLVTAAGSAPIGPEGGPRIGGPGGTPCGAPCPPPYGPEGAPYGAARVRRRRRRASASRRFAVRRRSRAEHPTSGSRRRWHHLRRRAPRRASRARIRTRDDPRVSSARAARRRRRRRDRGTAAATLPLAPPPPLCPIASFTCRNRFARSAAVCCAGCPRSRVREARSRTGARVLLGLGVARAGPPLRPYPPGGIDRGSTGGLRERQKQNARAFVASSVSALSSSSSSSAIDPSRSIVIESRDLSRVSRASSLARFSRSTEQRNARAASVVARVARRRSRRARVPSRMTRGDVRAAAAPRGHTATRARAVSVDAGKDARERAVRGRGRGSRHADGARARIEGDHASSIGDGGDESTRGDDDDDDDDQGVVANDGVVGERERGRGRGVETRETRKERREGRERGEARFDGFGEPPRGERARQGREDARRRGRGNEVRTIERWEDASEGGTDDRGERDRGDCVRDESGVGGASAE